MKKTFFIVAVFFCLIAKANAQQFPIFQMNTLSQTDSSNNGATTSFVSKGISTLANRQFDPRNAKAICDGTSHQLGTLFPGNLAAAQAAFPIATSLTQEVDRLALQEQINLIPLGVTLAGVTEANGGKLIIPHYGCFIDAPLVANNVSLVIQGEGHTAAALIMNGTDLLDFGLNNGMGVLTSGLGSTGNAYTTGHALSVNGLTCTTQPVLITQAVDSNGALIAVPSFTASGANPGVGCTPISNPVSLTDISGDTTLGSGATLNLTYTGGAISAISFAGTGVACPNGTVLTGTGGTNVTQQPIFTVTNSIGGVIQSGGYSVTNPGAYGTPPPNPVPFTASNGCTGASFNLNTFSNKGGSIEFDDIKFVQNGQGGYVLNAQHDTAAVTDVFRNVSSAVSSTSAYFSGIAKIIGGSNVKLDNINLINNLNVAGVQVSGPAFDFIEQNNLNGRYQYQIDCCAITGFSSCFKFEQNSNNPMQGIYEHNISCVQGHVNMDLENAGTAAIADVLFDTDQAQVDDGFLISNSSVIQLKAYGNQVNLGKGRTVNPATVCGSFLFNSVANQVQIHDNNMQVSINDGACAQAYGVTTSGSNSIYHDNYWGGGLLPSVIGYNFQAGSQANKEHDDLFGAGVTQVVDNGTNNVTMNAPQMLSFGTTATVRTVSGVQATVVDGGGFPRYGLMFSAGGYGVGAQLGVKDFQAPISVTTVGDTPINSTSMVISSATSVATTMLVSGQPGFVSNETIRTVSGTTIGLSAPTTADIPPGSAVTISEYQQPLAIPAELIPARFGEQCFNAGALTSGGTYKIPDHVSCVSFTSGATGQTIQLPDNPEPNQKIHLIDSFGTVTSLVMALSPNSASGITLANQPTTLGPLAPISDLFTGTRWEVSP